MEKAIAMAIRGVSQDNGGAKVPEEEGFQFLGIKSGRRKDTKRVIVS